MLARKIKETPTSNERAKFECELDAFISLTKKIEPLCRAKHQVLEALVHSTRLKVLKDAQKIEGLKKLILTCHDFVVKTAKNTKYEKIMNDLLTKLEIKVEGN